MRRHIEAQLQQRTLKDETGQRTNVQRVGTDRQRLNVAYLIEQQENIVSKEIEFGRTMLCFGVIVFLVELLKVI